MTDLNLRINQLSPDLQTEILKYIIIDIMIRQIDPPIADDSALARDPSILAFWSTHIVRSIGVNRVRHFLETINTSNFIRDFNRSNGRLINDINEMMNYLQHTRMSIIIPREYLTGLLKMYLSAVDVYDQIMAINDRTRGYYKLDINDELDRTFTSLIRWGMRR
jgi:hypothetical protein